jgi:hypothetical protein
MLLYGLAALLALFEIVVLWVALHPQVDADYRAYFLDQTITCLPQPVSGAYQLGQAISFTSENSGPAKTLRVCGWDGPAGDGLHSVGTRSLLRFALPDAHGQLRLTLEMAAIAVDGHPQQRVGISVNGIAFADITILAGETRTITALVPPEAYDINPQQLDVALDLPDAVKMNPIDIETRWRAIKLISGRLGL